MNKDQCKAVFEDEDFKVCKKNLNFFENFPGSEVWQWTKENKAVFCPHVNTCFCPACSSPKNSKEMGESIIYTLVNSILVYYFTMSVGLSFLTSSAISHLNGLKFGMMTF